MTTRLPTASSVNDALTNFVRAAYRFVFPPSCPLCHRDLETTTRVVAGRRATPVLCETCIAEVVPPPGNRCQRCGMPIGPYVPSEDGCAICRPRRFRFDRVIRLGLYDGLLREACIRGKSSGMQPLTAALANQLWLTERTVLEETDPDVVAPVPRYWTRRLAKDHHSAETISRVLARLLRRPHARTLLHKIRFTPDQSELSAAQRKQNLRNAFAVWLGRWRIRGKTVLLVDDILTTGTTANECSAALLRAGARRVVVAVIARVTPFRMETEQLGANQVASDCGPSPKAD